MLKNFNFLFLILIIISACKENTNRINSEKPNVIIILADDLGYGDISKLNSKSKINTPNIDRLVDQGMHFTDSHSGSAVCTPTRYGLLTGRYCFRSRLKSGVLFGYDEPLIEKDRVTIAQMMNENGYVTGCIGKWHLGLGWEIKEEYIDSMNVDMRSKTDFGVQVSDGPNEHGFDYSYIIPASLDMEPYVYLRNGTVVDPPDSITPEVRVGRGLFWREGWVSPGFSMEQVLPNITKDAVDFIRRTRKTQSEKPFFLYFPLTAPHTPWVPLEKYSGKSGAGEYGEFVVQVEEVVGTIYDVLDELNIRENTLLFFTSDNGAHWKPEDIIQYDHQANRGRRGQKADIWEGGHRVPFIVNWPGKIPAGSSSDELICHTDFMATLASMLQIELKKDIGPDSHSYYPYLINENRPGYSGRESLIHHSLDGMFAIRKGEWKLIEGLGSGGFSVPRRVEPGESKEIGQLYNISDDILESKNMWMDHPAKVDELQLELDGLRNSQGKN